MTLVCPVCLSERPAVWGETACKGSSDERHRPCLMLPAAEVHGQLDLEGAA